MRRLKARDSRGSIAPQRNSRSRGVVSQPSFDVGPKPAATAAGALHWECARAHPSVNGATVPARNALNIMGIQKLIYSCDPIRYGAVYLLVLRRFAGAQTRAWLRKGQLKLLFFVRHVCRSARSFHRAIAYPIVPSCAR